MKNRLYGLLILFSLLSFYSISFAVDFSIQPIRLYVSPKKNTAVFEITNLTDKKTIRVETEIKKWDQDENGKFILEDTEDAIVVPPYIELAPKQKQLIKLAYLGSFDGNIQKAYRLYIKQIPDEIKVEKNPKKVKTAIQIVVNISVPVFVNPPDAELKYNLSFTPVEVSKEKIVLQVRNTGNAFARITKAVLYKGDREIYSNDYALYILPQKNIKFVIKNIYEEDEKLKVSTFNELPDKIVITLEDGKEYTVNL
ncbi:fimbrial biogenesis chaperone [Persephonella sp.]|jgi:fimbrial chaperone protein